MIDILQRRKANEQAVEATSRPNQISARTLSNLMDERKTAKSEQEMRNIAKEYQLDFEVSYWGGKVTVKRPKLSLLRH